MMSNTYGNKNPSKANTVLLTMILIVLILMLCGFAYAYIQLKPTLEELHATMVNTRLISTSVSDMMPDLKETAGNAHEISEKFKSILPAIEKTFQSEAVNTISNITNLFTKFTQGN